MPRSVTLAILSDIHYASAAEQARGANYEFQGISNPLSRILLKAFRHIIWLRDPLKRNHLLQAFLDRRIAEDYVIANGDYSCDSGFVGVSDPAACQSALECLGKLRARFGSRLRATIGDHELGKLSLIGSRGGLRLASFYRARQELGLEPFWTIPMGRYVLMGLTSSLVAFPAYEPESLPEERDQWRRLRQTHMSEIIEAFSGLDLNQRVLLFCHDPTALPFLWREDAVRSRSSQIEQTVIGHLHSNLILWKSRVLAGMPAIGFLGLPARRITSALRDARQWRPFKVRLCPALAGIELMKDGGYCVAELDPDGRRPAQFRSRRFTQRERMGA